MKTPVHFPAEPLLWRILVSATDDDPLVLSRLLQKAAVPEIDLVGVSYSHAPRRAELLLRCSAARAELTRQKCERLAAVTRATLVPTETANTAD